MKRSQLTDRPIGPTSYGPQSGTGFFDFISKARNAINNTNNFLKRSKAISKVSGVASDLTGSASLRQLSQSAARNGYGRKVATPSGLIGMPMVTVRKGRKPGPKKGKKKAKK